MITATTTKPVSDSLAGRIANKAQEQKGKKSNIRPILPKKNEAHRR